MSDEKSIKEEYILEALWHLDYMFDDGIVSMSQALDIDVYCSASSSELIQILFDRNYLLHKGKDCIISLEGRSVLDGISPEWKMRHTPIECHAFQK